MITGNWLSGLDTLESILAIRKASQAQEKVTKTSADEKALHLLITQDHKEIACGRLTITSNGKIGLLDQIFILTTDNQQDILDFLLRMMIRKASDLGVSFQHAYINSEEREIYEAIGFSYLYTINNTLFMIHTGDVGGACK